jgi:biopolymer transport protein TolR
MAFPTASETQSPDSVEHMPLPDINVTPFIDVMLVLLIIFMVTAPMLASGMKVDLPRAAAAKKLHDQKPVIIAINAEGHVQVGGVDVTADTLIEAVQRELAGTDRLVQVRGDQEAPYKHVVSVIDRLYGGGITKFGIVTNPSKDPNASIKPLHGPL